MTKLTIKCDSKKDASRRKSQMYMYIGDLLDFHGFYINYSVSDNGDYNNIYITLKDTNGLESSVSDYIIKSIIEDKLKTNRKGYYCFK